VIFRYARDAKAIMEDRKAISSSFPAASGLSNLIAFALFILYEGYLKT